MLKTLSIKTDKRTQMLDITAQVNRAIADSGIAEGVVMVFVPHTTAGVTINENADPDVVSDIMREMNKVVPFEDHYDHMEGNSAAHIKASLFGFSEQIIIKDGHLLLGTWQGLYFCEFDGPRNRQLHVKLIAG